MLFYHHIYHILSLLLMNMILMYLCKIREIYNPQNEMFATFQTKRYFIQNETSSKKIIFQSIQEAVKKHWKILFLPVLFSLNSVGYVS